MPTDATTTAAACAGCGPYSDHCAGCPASRPGATHTDEQVLDAIRGTYRENTEPNTAEALAALVEALTPLMDRDYCSPFTSAWELDPYGGHNGDRDGEVIYEQVKAAWEQAQATTSGS